MNDSLQWWLLGLGTGFGAGLATGIFVMRWLVERGLQRKFGRPQSPSEDNE